jgi:hypothetical protein
MKLIADLLYLTEAESGISANTLKSARQRKSDGFVFMKDIHLGWLVQFDALKPEYKLQIMQRYNTADLYQYHRDNGFKAHLKPDGQAYLFFSRYTYDGGKFLMSGYVDAYMVAAQVMNALVNDKKLLDDAVAYINQNNIKLPREKRPLQAKLRLYKEEGYQCIVSKKFGNKCAEKAKDMALLTQLAGRPNNYDHALIAYDYNRLAVANGLPALSETRVHQLVNSSTIKAKITGKRHGNNAWRNDFDLIVSRKRPSAPLLMTVHDGFDWELYYQKRIKDSKGNMVTRHHFRKNVVVVVDAFNDYPLGFAIGDSETGDLIKLALKNATQHVYELTGGYYLQHEIKCDNFAKGSQEFFSRIATHVSPSKVGNARDKVVESWFKRFNDKYTIRHANYSGKNADALKKSQPNRDFLDKHKSQFPDEQGVCEQIIADINQQRADKLAAWMEGWNNCPDNLKRSITRAEYLELFATGETKRELTNLGLQIQVRGDKYLYMLLESDFVNSIGVQLTVKYDPTDMDTVLAIDEVNRKKWLVAMKEMMPMARMDQREGDRTALNKYLEFKDAREKEIIEANAADMEQIMSRSESEGILKGFFSYGGANKGIQAQAKRALISNEGVNEVQNTEVELQSAYRTKGTLRVIDTNENGLL